MAHGLIQPWHFLTFLLKTKEVNIITRITAVAISLFIFSASAYAGEFPIVGATYQLNRARFPGKIAVCCTEDAMDKYMEAKREDDQATMKKMLFKIKTMDDITKMKKANGCTLISNYSQAKIIKKGVESHQANFSAFPLKSMWGFHLYFGGKVK